MDTNKIVINIQKLCEINNISPNKALTESGVGKDFISNIKKGQTPTITKVKDIAEYFNVSVDYLLGNEKETKSDEEYSNPAFFKLKKGLEPYNLDERDVDFLLSVYKAHIEKNK